ncbi:histidine kinase [Reichenbachiella carrageenanivorans]|uniref:Histidine kinase n=1 Tax=Reichenbachiella carrageenanivorans TaxID=2979869 RepID=A0ABY6D4G8_9BACT|nr:histidine kinase [Reichenbachiella carrageenanivorans]UXX79948.1 histidine kinase [Reichenbachiella carrageenanivorans]
MKQIVSGFLLLMCMSIAQGQPPRVDSLLQRLKVETNDSLACVLSGNAGYYLATRNYDSSLLYLNRAISQAQIHHYPVLTVRFLCFLGMSNTVNGEIDSAVVSFERAIAIGQQEVLDSAVAQAHFGLGNVLESKGDIPEALRHYHEALVFFEAHGYDKAIAGVKANLSVAYFSIDAYEKAKPLILETNHYYETHGLTRRLVNGYQRLASVIEHEGKLDSSLFYLRKAEKIAREEKDFFPLSVIENHMGNVFLTLKKYEEAAGAYARSLDHKKSLGKNSEEYLKTYVNMAYCMAILNDKQAAADYLNKAEQMLAGIETKKFKIHYYKMKYKIDSVQQDYLLALDDYRAYTELAEDLFDEEKSRQLTEMETKYETDKKEAEIHALSQQSELQVLKISQQRVQLAVVLLLIVVIAVTLYFYLKQQRLKQAKETMDRELVQTKKQLELERQYKQSEVKAIKAQMNPHFVFNALNSIQDLIMLKDIRSSNEYLGKFADLMRKTLEASGKESIAVEDELVLMTHYLELEKLRFGQDFSFVLVNALDKNSSEDWLVPPLLIQPYVENAIKHGLLHKKGDKHLQVRFHENGAVLHCVIEDNGVGRKKAHEIKQRRAKKHLSFATEQNDRRIQLINETSPIKTTLEVEDLMDGAEAIGTRVVFTFSKSEADTLG